METQGNSKKCTKSNYVAEFFRGDEENSHSLRNEEENKRGVNTTVSLTQRILFWNAKFSFEQNKESSTRA